MRVSRSPALSSLRRWSAVTSAMGILSLVSVRLRLASILACCGAPGECRFRRAVEQRRHFPGDGERGGKPRRFNAIEVDEAGDAVLGRALQPEIRRGLAATADLGADAGIARLQRAVAEIGPVCADRGVEALAAARIDGVVDAVDPFDI